MCPHKAWNLNSFRSYAGILVIIPMVLQLHNTIVIPYFCRELCLGDKPVHHMFRFLGRTWS